MGGLWKLPSHYLVHLLLGTLALIGTPGFAYPRTVSLKRCIFAYRRRRLCLLRGDVGRFVTSFYSFRLYFLVFHGGSAWIITPRNICTRRRRW